MNIRAISLNDAERVTAIYNHYILNTELTMEIAAIDTIEMGNRIQKNINNGLPWLVAEDTDGYVIGYACANPWRDRAGYQYTVITSIYLEHNFKSGTGIGTILYTQLLNILEQKSIHVVIALITMNNTISVKLHERLGFEKMGVFREAGRKFNQWVSNECWQRVLPINASSY